MSEQPLVDPDCRAGKHASCVGEPCECDCHYAGPKTILAVDPGNTESGYALIDARTRLPLAFGKIPNGEMLRLIRRNAFDHLTIEMVASYGMAVGADVFETCVWIGRFVQCNAEQFQILQLSKPCDLIKRLDVKMHHCHNSKASDANISQALRDRFAHGVSNYGKGTKGEPGWFYGFSKDAWQAYALAVLVADRRHPVERPHDQLSLVGAP